MKVKKIGLVGINGSGKSTLLNIICGKEGHDEGFSLISIEGDIDKRLGYEKQYKEILREIRML